MTIYEQIPEREGPWPEEILIACGKLNKSRTFPCNRSSQIIVVIANTRCFQLSG